MRAINPSENIPTVRKTALTLGLRARVKYLSFLNRNHWRSSHCAVTHVRNKKSYFQGRSPNVVKVIFHTIRNCSGSKFVPLREVPFSKRDAIEENHCLIQ